MHVVHSISRLSIAAALIAAGMALSACAFRIDIQQGNLLDDEAIDQVAVGMSRSAVQFLLGTPMVADSFHRERWDYAYYFKRGRSKEIERRWLVVYFEGDEVARLDRDLLLEPSG